MWPAESMTNVIKEYNDQMEVHLYPEAGHLFIMNRYMGTPDALIAFGGMKIRTMKRLKIVMLFYLKDWPNGIHHN